MELTKNDIAKIEEEISYRKLELRPELLQNLKTARAQGDLSENFEYTMAKRLNNQNNSRVRYLENIVKTATIIEDTAADDEVGLNKQVTVYVIEDKEEETYKIVSSIRGNSVEGRISKESPMGMALMGHKAGDVVTIQVNETYSYDVEIRKVEPVPDDGADGLRQY
ncbi:MAG: transcription elongation factor GreA [Lachnospiraceae bacterium]|nr:transcription elongation factor GreA [Lachnospiraceae bacterium]